MSLLLCPSPGSLGRGHAPFSDSDPLSPPPKAPWGHTRPAGEARQSPHLQALYLFTPAESLSPREAPFTTSGDLDGAPRPVRVGSQDRRWSASGCTARQFPQQPDIWGSPRHPRLPVAPAPPGHGVWSALFILAGSGGLRGPHCSLTWHRPNGCIHSHRRYPSTPPPCSLPGPRLLWLRALSVGLRPRLCGVRSPCTVCSFVRCGDCVSTSWCH